MKLSLVEFPVLQLKNNFYGTADICFGYSKAELEEGPLPFLDQDQQFIHFICIDGININFVKQFLSEKYPNREYVWVNNFKV